MALPSTGAISIADVVVYRASASTAGPGWGINQNVGFNNMNSYRGSAYVLPTTYDDTRASAGYYDTCFNNVAAYLDFSYTNTSSIFTSAGKVYMVSLTANSGYNRNSKTCGAASNASGTATYIFQNAPAGSYQVGFSLSGGSASNTVYGYVGNTTNASAYGSTNTTSSTDTIVRFTIASTTSIQMKVQASPSGTPVALYNGTLRFRMMRTA